MNSKRVLPHFYKKEFKLIIKMWKFIVFYLSLKHKQIPIVYD